MKPLLVIAAVPQEVSLLQEALTNMIEHSGTIPHVSGTIGDRKLVICAGGIGKINAAIAASAMIERYQPHLIINTGCAGAYPNSGLAIGDLAVATVEILGDEGAVISSGWLDLQEMNLPLAKKNNKGVFNRIPVSERYLQKAVAIAGALDIKLATGSFVTVSTCSGTSQRGEEVARRFQGIAENMEGAAVALAALRYGVEFLEIRGISNQVEERDLAVWDMPKAMKKAQQLVLRLLQECCFIA